MDYQFSESGKVEEARIQAAYAKRQGSNLYSWFNPSYVFMAQEQERRMLVALEQHGFALLNTIRILEIGCGRGYWLREFIKWGAKPQNIKGIDLLSDRVEEARRLCPEGVEIKCGSAGKLDFRDETFDLVLQSTVFSSILDSSLRQQISQEMLRVLKENGAILWYDFHVNNPRNPDVQGVNKRAILHLFPGCRIELRRITLAPPLARFLAPYSLLACSLLEQLKVFNTHYLGVIRKA
ncbi:MAG TPA: class I SAM-dependent methyltransferase [Nitrospirales bacterium]|nr:SAM-dependent methyltransferase [Nitrospiraceae bacterium]HNP28683.1 class I SAM-dependent methyltransferase [Nitrospirales bacterium]